MPHSEKCREQAPEGFCIGGCSLTTEDLPALAKILGVTSDLTGWCKRGEHHGCSGRLLAATGHHWWCACDCHPVPVPPATEDGRKAFEVWSAAREESS